MKPTASRSDCNGGVEARPPSIHLAIEGTSITPARYGFDALVGIGGGTFLRLKKGKRLKPAWLIGWLATSLLCFRGFWGVEVAKESINHAGFSMGGTLLGNIPPPTFPPNVPPQRSPFGKVSINTY